MLRLKVKILEFQTSFFESDEVVDKLPQTLQTSINRYFHAAETRLISQTVPAAIVKDQSPTLAKSNVTH